MGSRRANVSQVIVGQQQHLLFSETGDPVQLDFVKAFFVEDASRTGSEMTFQGPT